MSVQILEFTVSKKSTLVEVVRQKVLEKFPAASNSKIRRLIAAGQVFVNKKQIRFPASIVEVRDRLCIKIDSEKFFAEKTVRDIDFLLGKKDVLFEDDFFIVVNKPAFFPVEQTVVGNRKNLHDEVVHYLWAKNPDLRNQPYVGILHRLDCDTSGAILFTKKREINKAIFKMFENRTIEKTYYAVVSVPQKSACAKGYVFGDVQLPISFSVKNYLSRATSKFQQGKWHATAKNTDGAQFAHTDFKVLAHKKSGECNLFFVQAKPHTGRTHQIRVHLAESGAAICGDEIYGGKKADRLMLHAYSLEFVHPVTGENIFVIAPLPEIFGFCDFVE